MANKVVTLTWDMPASGQYYGWSVFLNGRNAGTRRYSDGDLPSKFEMVLAEGRKYHVEVRMLRTYVDTGRAVSIDFVVPSDAEESANELSVTYENYDKYTREVRNYEFDWTSFGTLQTGSDWVESWQSTTVRLTGPDLPSPIERTWDTGYDDPGSWTYPVAIGSAISATITYRYTTLGIPQEIVTVKNYIAGGALTVSNLRVSFGGICRVGGLTMRFFNFAITNGYGSSTPWPTAINMNRVSGDTWFGYGPAMAIYEDNPGEEAPSLVVRGRAIAIATCSSGLYTGNAYMEANDGSNWAGMRIPASFAGRIGDLVPATDGNLPPPRNGQGYIQSIWGVPFSSGAFIGFF